MSNEANPLSRDRVRKQLLKEISDLKSRYFFLTYHYGVRSAQAAGEIWDRIRQLRFDVKLLEVLDEGEERRHD